MNFDSFDHLDGYSSLPKNLRIAINLRMSVLRQQLAEEKTARERTEKLLEGANKSRKSLSYMLRKARFAKSQRIEQLEAQIEKARELVQQWRHEATEANSSFVGVWLTIAANELEAILSQSQEENT